MRRRNTAPGESVWEAEANRDVVPGPDPQGWNDPELEMVYGDGLCALFGDWSWLQSVVNPPGRLPPENNDPTKVCAAVDAPPPHRRKCMSADLNRAHVFISSCRNTSSACAV